MPDPSHIVRVHPDNPEPGIILKAGKILARNGIVVFPAKCLYGVAVNAMDKNAVQKVFNLKQRPLNNPLLVLVKDRAMIQTLVKEIPPIARHLMEAFWPGSLTLVFRAKDHLPGPLTAGTGKIGIRFPSHAVARAMVNAVDFPVTGTSANLSGKGGCSKTALLDPSIIRRTDLILDAGTLKGGKGSTIADVTQNSLKILRQGEVSFEQIQKVLA